MKERLQNNQAKINLLLTPKLELRVTVNLSQLGNLELKKKLLVQAKLFPALLLVLKN